MPVKISPIKILSDLGYEMVDIETDEDYLSALREGIVTIEAATKGSGDKRSEALREEFLRVREERKSPNKKVKISQKKISPSKFFDKKEKKSDVGGKGGAIVKIGNSVTSIVETLKEDQKQDKKQQGWFRKMVERFKRRKKENKLEFKIFDGIKKTATKLLAPMKNAWSEFLGFIGKVILGRVLFKILKWMGNKDNQGKLQSIIKFFQDWWPAMLAGYLLFGNAFTSFAATLVAKAVWWGAKLLATVIPALVKGLAAMGPWGIAAAGVMGVGGYMLMSGGGGDEETSQKAEEITDEDPIEDPSNQQNFKEGGLVQHFKQGGFVSGPGGVDKVPAKLTAGEFVMSKGAVQKYGANTLAAMNAAGGGTNKPTMGRYNEGGVITDPEERKQQEAYMLKFVNEERALQGMEPLKNLTYAPGVELTKMRGPGPRIKETSDTFTDFDKGITTKSKSRTVDGKTSFAVKMGQTTPEERQQFFAENPHAAQLVNLKNQIELDNLGADISASARMNGGGLVQNFQGGGLVQNFQGGGQVKGNSANITPRKTATVITPSEKKKVTVVYEEEKQNMADNSNAEKSSQQIPAFNVLLGRSSKKISLLGISV